MGKGAASLSISSLARLQRNCSLTDSFDQASRVAPNSALAFLWILGRRRRRASMYDRTGLENDVPRSKGPTPAPPLALLARQPGDCDGLKKTPSDKLL